MAKAKEPVCYFCGKSVDPVEDFCHGCKHLVCLRCYGDTIGHHAVRDHRLRPTQVHPFERERRHTMKHVEASSSERRAE